MTSSLPQITLLRLNSPYLKFSNGSHSNNKSARQIENVEKIIGKGRYETHLTEGSIPAVLIGYLANYPYKLDLEKNPATVFHL
jgi:hypothetical protein